jgi:hypothetical protein
MVVVFDVCTTVVWERQGLSGGGGAWYYYDECFSVILGHCVAKSEDIYFGGQGRKVSLALKGSKGR